MMLHHPSSDQAVESFGIVSHSMQRNVQQQGGLNPRRVQFHRDLAVPGRDRGGHVGSPHRVDGLRDDRAVMAARTERPGTASYNFV